MTLVLISFLGGAVIWAMAFSQRVARMEVIIELLSNKAARILHSPHTPELDIFIERLQNDTLQRADVPTFIEALIKVENDTDEPKGSRLAAVLTHIKVCRRFNLSIPAIDDYAIGWEKSSTKTQ